MEGGLTIELEGLNLSHEAGDDAPSELPRARDSLENLMLPGNSKVLNNGVEIITKKDTK